MKTRRKIAWIITAAVVLVIAGIYIYLVPMGGFREIAETQIIERIEPNYPLKIRIGKISGSMISGIVLKDVVVDYSDSLHQYRMAYIPYIRADYSLSALLTRNYDFDDFRIDSARVTLKQDEEGKWLVPNFSSPGGGTGKSGLPLIMIASLRITGSDLTLERLSDTLRIEQFNLTSSVQMEGKTYAADIKQLSFTSNRKAIGLDNAEGKVTFTDGELYAQDLSVIRGDNRIKLNGQVNLNDPVGRLDINSDNFNLENLKPLIGVNLRGIMDVTGQINIDGPSLWGELNLGGTLMDLDVENVSIDFSYRDKHLGLDTVYGSVLGGMSIDGAGHIDFAGSPATYALEGNIRNFNLDNLVKGSFVSNLNGRLDLAGSSFSGSNMKIIAGVDLYESSFDRYALHEAKGTLFITHDSLKVVDTMHIRYYENSFAATGGLAYSGDMNINVLADFENLDRFKGKFFISEPGGRAKANVRFTGRTKDPNLSGSLSSDSLWVYGLYSDSVEATIDLNRFLTRQKGKVDADFFYGNAWSIPYDTGRTRLTMDSGLVNIDSAAMVGQYSNIFAHGTFDYATTPYDLDLDSLNVKLFDQTLHNLEPIVIKIDSGGFNFEQVDIGNPEAKLAVLGRVSYEEEINLAVTADNIEIAPWLQLSNIGYEIKGLLSFQTQISGTLVRPRFTLTTTVDSLVYIDTTYYSYQEIPLGHLAAGFDYANRKLTIDSVRVRSEKGAYNADGYMYVDLAMVSDSLQRLIDEPFNISFSANDEQFDLVSVFMPSVEKLNGQFFTNLTMSGTPSEPHLNGWAFVRDMQMKYFDLKDSIYADSVGAVINDNDIRISDLSVYVKDPRNRDRKSYVDVDGTITVKSPSKLDYDLNVSMPREFPFRYELEDISGVVEGDLTVQGVTPPTVSGNLTLISFNYRVPFAEPGGSVVMEALSGENTWDLDLSIDILSNFWIKNSDLDAQMNGFLNLKREKGISHFLGQLTFIRGKSYLFDKTFNIDQGSEVIFQDIQELNPTLNITAHTKIIGITVPGQVGQEQFDLCVTVTGTLDAPVINTCQGSPFTQQDILPLLVANYYSSGDTTTVTPFADRVTQLLSVQLSQLVPGMVPVELRNKIGLETFEIDPVYEGGNFKGTSLTVGVSPLAQLYVYGRSTPFTGQYGQEVGFEYRFNQSFLLEGRRTEQDEYVLNLKLHWEF